MITAKELYPSVIQLIIHAETISWNRFYNFLMFNTILILAWATVYSQEIRPAWGSAVLAIMCVLGGVSGLAWAGLGVRGRKFLNEYLLLAEHIEADAQCWSQDVQKYKPITLTRQWISTFPFGCAGSRFLLTGGSLAFTAFYGFLLYVSVI